MDRKPKEIRLRKTFDGFYNIEGLYLTSGTDQWQFIECFIIYDKALKEYERIKTYYSSNNILKIDKL